MPKTLPNAQLDSAELVRVAAAAKVERRQIAELRRGATIARRGIAQILETVTEYGFGDDEWSRLRHDTQALITRTERAERLEEITIGVGSLERRHTGGPRSPGKSASAGENCPQGVEYIRQGIRPHNILTKPAPYPEQDMIVARQGGNVPADPDLRTTLGPKGSRRLRPPRPGRRTQTKAILPPGPTQ